MSKAHTPTPWKLAAPESVYALDETGKTNRFYFHVQGGYSTFNTQRTSDDELAANAEFIIRACNVHDALVAALKDARSLVWAFTGADDAIASAVIAAADDALAKAEPQS